MVKMDTTYPIAGGGDKCPSTGRILISCNSGSSVPFSCHSRYGVNDWLTGCTEEGAPGALQLNSLVSGDPFTCLWHNGKLFPHTINYATCQSTVAELNSALLKLVAPSIGSKIYTAGTQQTFPELFCGSPASEGIPENSGVRTKGGKMQCEIAASMLNVHFGPMPTEQSTSIDCPVSGSGFPFYEISVIEEGHATWSGRSYKWNNVPDELVGARYFKGEHTYPPAGNSPATLKNEGTSDVDVYILYEPSGSADVNRDGGFGSGVAGFSDTGLTIDGGMNHDNAGPMKVLKKDTPLPPGGSVTLPELDPIDVCRGLPPNEDRIHAGNGGRSACDWVGAYAMKCITANTSTTSTRTTITTTTTTTTATILPSLHSSDCDAFVAAMAIAHEADQPRAAIIACDPLANDGELSTAPENCFAAAEQLNAILGSLSPTSTATVVPKATASGGDHPGKLNIDDANFCSSVVADTAECDTIARDACGTTRFGGNVTMACPFLCVCGGIVGMNDDDTDNENDDGSETKTQSNAIIIGVLLVAMLGSIGLAFVVQKRKKGDGMVVGETMQSNGMLLIHNQDESNTDDMYGPIASLPPSDDVYGPVSNKHKYLFSRVVSADCELYSEIDDNPLAALAGIAMPASLKAALDAAKGHCGDLSQVNRTAMEFVEQFDPITLAPASAIVDIQIAAINAYTQPTLLYGKVNAALGDYGPDGRASLVHYLPYIKLLDNAMQSLPPLTEPGGGPVTLFRGVKRPAFDLIGGLKEGDTLTWWSFTSTTTTSDMLQNTAFLGIGKKGEAAAHGKKRTVFHIKAFSGVSIKMFSAISNEDEVLFRPGSQFVIDGISEWHYGITEVRMHQVPSDVMPMDVEASDAGLYEATGDFNSDDYYEPIDTYMVPVAASSKNGIAELSTAQDNMVYKNSKNILYSIPFEDDGDYNTPDGYINGSSNGGPGDKPARRMSSHTYEPIDCRRSSHFSFNEEAVMVGADSNLAAGGAVYGRLASSTSGSSLYVIYGYDTPDGNGMAGSLEAHNKAEVTTFPPQRRSSLV